MSSDLEVCLLETPDIFTAAQAEYGLDRSDTRPRYHQMTAVEILTVALVFVLYSPVDLVSMSIALDYTEFLPLLRINIRAGVENRWY